jgi:hypothetical protein
MAIKIPHGYKNIPTFSIPRPPKYSQIGIFGMQIYHLAILVGYQNIRIRKAFTTSLLM